MELEVAQSKATKEWKNVENGASLLCKAEMENETLHIEVQSLTLENAMTKSARRKMMKKVLDWRWVRAISGWFCQGEGAQNCVLEISGWYFYKYRHYM